MGRLKGQVAALLLMGVLAPAHGQAQSKNFVFARAPAGFLNGTANGNLGFNPIGSYTSPARSVGAQIRAYNRMPDAQRCGQSDRCLLAPHAAAPHGRSRRPGHA